MKTLKEFITEHQIKMVRKDFKDSMEALKWLEYDVDANEYGIADITIKGKTASLHFGLTKNDRNPDTMENLYLCANKFNGPYHTENLTDDFYSMGRGEFCDMVDGLIKQYGD